MPHTIAHNEGLGVIVLRATGCMDVAELEQAMDALVLVPGFKEGLSLIIDFRGSDTHLTADDLRELAVYARRTDTRWGETKWAILASKIDTFGLCRMFMAHTDEHQVETRVFRGVTEADDWLGLGVEMAEILVRTPA